MKIETISSYNLYRQAADKTRRADRNARSSLHRSPLMGAARKCKVHKFHLTNRGSALKLTNPSR
jgi:hypothetical protein